jgi:hypothetical protein
MLGCRLLESAMNMVKHPEKKGVSVYPSRCHIVLMILLQYWLVAVHVSKIYGLILAVPQQKQVAL